MSANGTNPNLPSRLRSGRLPGDNRTFSNPGSTLQHPGNSPNSLGAAVVSSHRASDRRARRVPAATFTARLEKYRCRDRPRAVSLYPGRCRRLFRGTAGAAGRVRQWTGGQRDAAPAWMNSAPCLHHWIFSRDQEFADSSLEGDGFEPSVPGTKEPVFVAEGELRGPNGGSQKRLFLIRYRWFESISLQQRVRCEPDFLGRIPSMTVGISRDCAGPIGQHHRISGHLLHQYANEAAWREDNRRKPNGTNWNAVIGAALAGPKTPVWTGYWHRSASRPSRGRRQACRRSQRRVARSPPGSEHPIRGSGSTRRRRGERRESG